MSINHPWELDKSDYFHNRYQEKPMKRFFKQAKFLIILKAGFTGVILLFLCQGPLQAQETQYSLFEFSPLYLNPANTGNFKGNWRASINYRNQWAAAANAFTTSTASFDVRMNFFGQKISAGAYFLNDESGIGGLTYNKFYASLGIEKDISNQVFSLALQGGFVSGKVNSWLGWDENSRDFTAPNGETNFGENVSYFDLNAGLLWKTQIGIVEPEVGIALSHLNTPSNSYFGDKNQKESMRMTLHARAKVNLSDELFLFPALLYSSKNSVINTQVGTDFGYRFVRKSRVKQLFVGAYIRNGILENLDALSVRAGTTIGRLDIALNYDITLSNLSTSGQMGAFEIGIIYRGVGLVLNSYSIPCERY